MKLIRVTFICIIILMLTACNYTGDRKTSTERNRDFEVIADNLSNPWSIEINDNTFYLTERNGNMVEITNGKVTRHKLQTNKPVLPTGEGGLLGFVLAPNFAETKQAYTYHTYKENGEVKNRVIVIEKASSGWREVRPLLEGIPGGTIHNGGRLAIGPDQHLYITTGDSGKEDLAQDRNSLAGKILRLKLSGDIPSDNPFPNSPVYSYGHRNSQGLAWSTDGVMYASEHGPSPMGGHDEMNKIEPGKNYGWPAIIGDEKKEGMITPLFQTGNETWAPSGMKITDQNEILIACLRGEKLVNYTLSTGKTAVVLDGVGRLRDVFLNGKDVYVITGNGENDKLLRITN